MNITKKTRQELRGVFSTGNVPTEEDFADLFESSLNLEDDNYIFEQLEANDAQNSEDITALTQRMSAEETKSTGISTRVGVLETKENQDVTTITQRVGAEETKSTGLATRISTLEAVNTSTRISTLESQNTTMSTRVGAEETKSTGLATRIITLEAVNTSTRISTLESQNTTMSTRVGAEETKSTGLATRISTLEAINISTRIGALEDIIDPPLTVMQPQVADLAAVTYNSRIFMLGGNSPLAAINNVTIYSKDPMYLPSIATRLKIIRSSHSAIIKNDRVYIMGGISVDKATGFITSNDIEIYQIDKKGIYYLYSTTLAVGRHRAAAEIVGNRIYMLGGYSINTNTFLDTIEILDTNAWGPAILSSVRLPAPRAYHSSAVYNNRIYVIGGTVGNMMFSNNITILTVDTNSGAVTATNSTTYILRNGRSNHTSVVIGSRLYVVGGELPMVNNNNTGRNFTRIVEVYNILNNGDTIVYAGNLYLSLGRGYCANVVIDNKIYVLGGAVERPAGVVETNDYAFTNTMEALDSQGTPQ